MMIKDRKQLDDAPAFSFTAVEGILAVEQSLQKALRFVPYCDAHRKVWSPRFATIILEAAHQVDSIWVATARLDDSSIKPDDQLSITDHHSRFGGYVAKQHVVLFGNEQPSLVTPFADWPKTAGDTGPIGPPWWKAYTALKHDRFSNQHQGTLEHAVNAVAGLLLAIVYSGRCDLAIVTASLLDTGSYNPWAYAEQLRDIKFDSYPKIETKLFAHPLGVFGKECNLSSSWQSKSVRWNAWWALNSGKFTKPKSQSK